MIRIAPQITEVLHQDAALIGVDAVIDETVAEAHATLGFINWHYEWDWATSEKEFKRAIKLNPSYATAHHWYAHVLTVLARHDEAIAEIERARALDPLSVAINKDVSELLWYARRFDESIEAARRTLEIDPGNVYARGLFTSNFYYKGAYQEYIDELQAEVTRTKRDPNALRGLAAYFRLNRRSEAESVLDELKRRGESTEVDRYRAFGDKEPVYQWIEADFKNRGAGVTFLNVKPHFDDIRSDARFQDYVRCIGLLQQTTE